jgi:hypothetical protein
LQSDQKKGLHVYTNEDEITQEDDLSFLVLSQEFKGVKTIEKYVKAEIRVGLFRSDFYSTQDTVKKPL